MEMKADLDPLHLGRDSCNQYNLKADLYWSDVVGLIKTKSIFKQIS